jgi:hypothetical protein
VGEISVGKVVRRRFPIGDNAECFVPHKAIVLGDLKAPYFDRELFIVYYNVRIFLVNLKEFITLCGSEIDRTVKLKGLKNNHIVFVDPVKIDVLIFDVSV